MDERVEIGKPIKEICDLLGGLDPGRVGRIEFLPTSVEVDYYKINEHGSKYVEQDGEDRGKAAMETLSFAVSTNEAV